MIKQIFSEYKKWRKNWDALCARCGQCCYARSNYKGEVIIDYSAPCEHFNKENNLCAIFNERFKKCDHCQSVNIFRALFYPRLPHSCAYYKTFRVWRKN